MRRFPEPGTPGRTDQAIHTGAGASTKGPPWQATSRATRHTTGPPAQCPLLPRGAGLHRRRGRLHLGDHGQLRLLPPRRRARFIDLTAPAVSEIMLNGQPLGPGSPSTATGSRWRTWRPRTSCGWRAVLRLLQERRGAAPVQRPRRRRRLPVLRPGDLDAHRVYACFDQPDLKATFELTVTVPAGWQVISNMAPDVDRRARGRAATRPLALPAVAGDVHLHHRGRGRAPTTRCVAEHDGIPLGLYCRASLAQYLDPGRDLRGDPAGVRLLPRRRSAPGTRSASTTSSSCRSTRRARWRTRDA